MHQTERAGRRGRAIFSRVLADVIFVNVSMFAAVTIRYLIRVSDETIAVNIHALKQAFFAFYYTAAPLLTLLTVLVFFAFGVYTRTRFYARKHKAVILLQAITVA